eukprot:CAMPEP_0194511676 /NCGR_PEP_ID=MMETSP0253-20130528/43404_1 /TAXON_ID=2966 /ORGANISM="Noctiluca scintillans" /LENGTH=441 /DNA_ID=CAMNT_0039355029 /DNA_START=96 /DNA_END=1418 /DNA_ORIENTATION=+
MFDGEEDFGGGFGRFGGGGGGRGFGRKPEPRVPLTILCGFLGAGKTTLVQHILRNREGLKVGVVVNDVAEANIDSEVLSFDDADGIVGLQNGCACCSGRQDLFTRLQELVESSGVSKLDRPWDRLVVECSGVAEPESIAQELEAMSLRGDPVMKRIFLAGIVCVVDASTFWEAYNSEGTATEDRKSLSALLVSQLESSDTAILNKTDLVDDEALNTLSHLLTKLNLNARQLRAVRGALPLRTLMPAEPVDLDMPAYVPTLSNRHTVAVRSAELDQKKRLAEQVHEHGHAHESGSGHEHEHGHAHDPGSAGCAMCAATVPSHDRFGISSFVYRRQDRAFDPKKLSMLAHQLPVKDVSLDFSVDATDLVPLVTLRGVLRSKGFVHVTGDEKNYYWSHAGRELHVGSCNVKRRVQELVFIGVDLNEAAIIRALDDCLELADSSL